MSKDPFQSPSLQSGYTGDVEPSAPQKGPPMPESIRRRAQGSGPNPPRQSKGPAITHFLPQETEVTLSDGIHRVIVGPDALLYWWGANSGPQTAEGLLDAHRPEIEAAVLAKLARGFRPRSGAVRIGEDDLL